MKNVKKITFVDFKGKEKNIPENKWSIGLMLPVQEKPISYVRNKDVKVMCENNKLNYSDLCHWLTGQTCPIIEEEGPDGMYDCFYSWDIESYVYHQIKYNKEPQFVD